MVPDKFNMVDMGGIDLIMMQGEEVPGLYNRLVESITQCRYQCLYNWLFDGVIIPPTYVELEVNENDEVAINEGVTVTQDDIIHIYSIEPPDPEIIPLLAEENGVYNVPTGKDGFNPVTVDVPSYTPVIQSKSITENGTYTAPEGIDGYSPVIVNVPSGYTEEVFGYVALNCPMYQGGYEYKSYIYGTQIVENLDLVLLYDASQGGVTTVTLQDNISNFSGIILQGIYNQERGSAYNTTLMYLSPVIGHTYWAGMKDRNSSYTCNVTIDSDTQVTLSGNKQVIIYGIY